jgi:GT2 family glycosyltransferase
VKSRSLSVSIVTYLPDTDVLAQTLRALRAAIEKAHSTGSLVSASVYVVDNGPDSFDQDMLTALTVSELASTVIPVRQVLSEHRNNGYGQGNNIAIREAVADYHLVLNPDVLLEPDAVAKALDFMEQRPDVGLMSPAAFYPDGQRQYLCKRYPTLLDLALRGFGPRWLQWIFRHRLNRYEMRDVIADEMAMDVPIVSGCFMLFRRSVLNAVGGFSNRFFMYFEDFDISLRASHLARIAYVPAVRIVHLGGGTGHKGLKHVAMFLRSAWAFFSIHGWRIL